MKSRIIAIILFAITVFLPPNQIKSNAENNYISEVYGGLWKDVENFREDSGNTIIDCSNYNTQKQIASSDIPSSFDITTNEETKKFFPPIGNQGTMNSCVGWATTYYQYTYEVNRYKNEPTTEENIYSPAWTYNYINGGSNTSTYIDDGYAVLHNQGAMKLVDYPHPSKYSQYSFNWSTDIPKMIDALEYRTTLDTYCVTDTTYLNKVKERIANGHVAVVWTNTLGWTVRKNDSGENVIVRSEGNQSGHFMTVVGYDDDFQVTVNGVTLKGAFKLANSMGTKWSTGNNGYIWVAYDALDPVSSYGTEWQEGLGYKERGMVFASRNINYFHFINVHKCNLYMIGQIDFVSKDPWNLTLYADASDNARTKKWSSSIGSPLSVTGKYTMVFDFFNAGSNYDMNDYLSSNWTVRLNGNPDYNTYNIFTRILDSEGNQVSPPYPYYGKIYGDFDSYSKTTSINLAKGRVTAYDNNEITAEDVEMVENYIDNNVEFSELQQFLADYNNDGSVDIQDVELMNRTLESDLNGDINNDGEFTVADVVALQKWLLAVPDVKLADWKAGDLCEDDRLDVFDLCLMKRELLKSN